MTAKRGATEAFHQSFLILRLQYTGSGRDKQRRITQRNQFRETQVKLGRHAIGKGRAVGVRHKKGLVLTLTEGQRVDSVITGDVPMVTAGVITAAYNIVNSRRQMIVNITTDHACAPRRLLNERIQRLEDLRIGLGLVLPMPTAQGQGGIQELLAHQIRAGKIVL